jgi:hypothetical protein
MSKILKRTRSRTAGVAAAVLAAAGLAGVPAANAAPQAFNFQNSSYILTLRAGAVEPYAVIPRDLPTDIGFSYVDLVHDLGQKQGRCETWGAGYWLGTEVEEGVLGLGAAPPDAGDVSHGYKNPTTSRQVRPDLTPAGEPSGSDRTPVIPAAGTAGPHWVATCNHDAKGSGTGELADVAGAKFVGSTSAAEVNKVTGLYTGISRSYIQDLEIGGNLVTITSLMQVKQTPTSKPVITYRLSFLDGGPDGKNYGLNQNGFTVAGTNVPADPLVEQFNSQVEQGAGALAALGPYGLSLLAPHVGKSTDGDRFSITAPVIQGKAGLKVREGTIGQEQGLRFGSVTFQGAYGDN